MLQGLTQSLRGCRINAVMFYAPQLFNSLGSGKSASLLSAVIIGAINAVSTSPFLPNHFLTRDWTGILKASNDIHAVLGFRTENHRGTR